MLPAFAPEHRFGFRVFAKQAAIDQRCQIRAAASSKLCWIRLVDAVISAAV